MGVAYLMFSRCGTFKMIAFVQEDDGKLSRSHR